MKHTSQFAFQTRYFHPYYKKDMGELMICGKGYYNDKNHSDDGRHDDDPESLFDFDIESLHWNMIDVTKLWHTKEVLNDSLIDIVKKSTLAHMEWVFKDEIAIHFGEEIEHEDMPDSIEFPTAEEFQQAVKTIRNYSVIAIAGTTKQLLSNPLQPAA